MYLGGKITRYFQILIAVIGSFVMFGCKETLTPEEFTAWFENEENGFIFNQTIDSFSYKIQYRPNELMSLIAYKGDNNQNLSVLKREFSEDWYFKLNICEIDKKKDALKTNLGSESDYFKRVHFLSEEIKENAFLILQSNDTAWCTLHVYERTYNINPCQTLLFSFPKSKAQGISKFILYDKVFSGKPIEFDVDQIDRKKYPQFKL
jgi:hypothetical protein